MVVLGAELKVGHDHGDLGARDDNNKEHEEQEAEQVVVLILPDGREDEEELDEAGAEGQHARHQRADQRMHVPDLVGHLARYLIGAHRLRVRLLAVAEVVAEEHEGQRDAEDHGEQGDHGRERHRARRSLAPDEEVEQERGAEQYERVEEGGGERGLLPLNAAQRLVQAAAVVARYKSHEHVEEEAACDQGAAVRWREHAQHGEYFAIN